MTAHDVRERLAPAISALQEALNKDPSNGQLHHAMAGLLILSGELGVAASHARRAEASGIPTEALRSFLKDRDPPE